MTSSFQRLGEAAAMPARIEAVRALVAAQPMPRRVRIVVGPSSSEAGYRGPDPDERRVVTLRLARSLPNGGVTALMGLCLLFVGGLFVVPMVTALVEGHVRADACSLSAAVVLGLSSVMLVVSGLRAGRTTVARAFVERTFEVHGLDVRAEGRLVRDVRAMETHPGIGTFDLELEGKHERVVVRGLGDDEVAAVRRVLAAALGLSPVLRDADPGGDGPATPGDRRAAVQRP